MISKGFNVVILLVLSGGLVMAANGGNGGAVKSEPTNESSTKTMVKLYGTPCEGAAIITVPYSVVYIDDSTGEVEAVESLSCEGQRSSNCDGTGKMKTYQAYNTPLLLDNSPRVGQSFGGGLLITLAKPARVEVRLAETGELISLATPSSQREEYFYDVSADLVEQYDGRLLVVDVVDTLDGSCRGTASVVFHKK